MGVQRPGGERKLNHWRNWNDSGCAKEEVEGERMEAEWYRGEEGGLCEAWG